MSNIENENRIHAIWKLSQATTKLFERQDRSDEMAIAFIKEALEVLETLPSIIDLTPTIDLSTILPLSPLSDEFLDESPDENPDNISRWRKI